MNLLISPPPCFFVRLIGWFTSLACDLTTALLLSSLLTGVEGDFTDNDEIVGEEHLELDDLGDSVMKVDGDVARVLQYQVRHVVVRD